MSPPAALDDVAFDDRGLVCVVAQDEASGAVRMVAWANREALQRTLESGRAWFFSRSRQRLWCKGEESGNHLDVGAVWLDCDGDTVLYQVRPAGPTCHTGEGTCFFRRVGASGAADAPLLAPGTILAALDAVFTHRAQQDPETSYVASLLPMQANRARGKIGEEADELCDAVLREGPAEVCGELADVVFHALVAAFSRGVTSEDLLRELNRRFGTGGHAEKASRG